MYSVETVPFARARGQLLHETAQFAIDYWDRLRRGRALPDRRDLEPADMAPVLGQLILLETFAGSVSFRLAGTRFTRQLGRETRGTSAATIWRGHDRARFEALIRTLVSMPGGAMITADMIIADRPPTPFEFLVLPMTFRSEAVTRFLGTAAPLREDYWLGTETPLGFEMRQIVLFDSQSPGMASSAVAQHEPVRIHRHLAIYQGGVGGSLT
jgi:hypothetical protein